MKAIRCTTAIAAALSLVMGPGAPRPATAQEAGPELCTTEAALPCTGPEGEVFETEEALKAAIDAGLDLPSPEDVAGEAEQAVESAAEAAAESADGVVEDVLPQVAEETADEPEAEVEPVEEAEAEAEEVAEDAATGAAQTAEEAGDDAEETGAAAMDEAAEAETQAADGAAEAEAEVAADSEAEAAAETEGEVTEDAAQMESDAASEGADEAMTADTDTDMEAEAEAPTAETQSIDETQAEAGVGAISAEEQAELEARQAEADAASAAASADSEAAEVTTTEVTEEDARSSTEDFDTQTAASGQANTQGSADESGGSLSNFERALLVGLGAVAVGSILDNGDEVVSSSGDRVVVKRNGELTVLKDDDVLIRRPGANVRTETFSDGSTRTTVTNPDGSEVVTVRAPDGRVLRRDRYLSDGTQVALFDDTQEVAPVEVSSLPQSRPSMEREMSNADRGDLRAALAASAAEDVGRTFSLRQVRQIEQVRDLAPVVTLDAITFATGSAAIRSEQAQALFDLGQAIEQVLADDPGAVFLIEGHTDAVGDAGYNLALSDRRAETVALALTEYFDIPPENLVTQGYGERHLKVRTLEAEQANRRAAVRNITRLLRGA